jgi:HAD superfamily hydrolase (TIGR01509 family)
MPAGPWRDDVQAVAFDLDGVLIDSETIWDDVRRAVVANYGGTWLPGATRKMMGMSSGEWSAYMRDELGVPLPASRISTEVAELVAGRYAERLPLLPGAREAVLRLAQRWPLAVASSSNRTIIDRFLQASGLGACFAATVSSEEVERGKPAPDVYLAAAARLGAAAERCVAIEDSTNGIRSAVAATMKVIAVPNTHFPPAADALALATVVLPDLASLTTEQVQRAADSPSGRGRSAQ